MFPNEFTIDEKIMWCNELGAMLCREHMVMYEKTTINQNGNGSYTLPAGLKLLDVERIIGEGRVLRKQDIRSRGITYLNAPKGTEGTPISFKKRLTGAIDVVYQKKYEEVRNIEDEYIATMENDTFTVKESSIKEGDLIDIFAENEVYTGTVKKREEIDKNKVVFTMDFVFDEKDNGEQNIFVIRHLTDETVVDEPFDMLYIDFINAKICFHQRDYESYNAHMTIFNSRLADLDLYLAKAMPVSPDTSLKNWF